MCFRRLKDCFANVQNLLDISTLKSRTGTRDLQPHLLVGEEFLHQTLCGVTVSRPVVLTTPLLCSELPEDSVPMQIH